MAKKGGAQKNDDILWNMLQSELRMDDIRELEEYLRGESGHFDMGYGPLNIEPVDGLGGTSRMFRLRHDRYGETTISRSAFLSVLNDLLHSYRREQQRNRGIEGLEFGDIN